MRTFKSVVLALVLLAGTTLSAATEPSVEKTNKEEAIVEIAQLLKNPKFELQEDTRASVILMVNSENELVVLSVDTESNLVESYVKTRLNYQKLEHSLEKGKEYRLPVVITSVK